MRLLHGLKFVEFFLTPGWEGCFENGAGGGLVIEVVIYSILFYYKKYI